MTFSLADLSQSVFASLGLSGSSDLLNVGPSPFGRECFLLVDGMGQNVIDQYSDQFPILKDFASPHRLASHFPSTTATNISSVGTGEFPGAHGMLGYTVRVPRSGTPGRLLNALKWDERVDPVMWQKVPTLFERAARQGITVSHVADKRYEGSGFTQAALRGATYIGANGIPDLVANAARSLSATPSYTYLYSNVLDHAGHEFGVGSDEWVNALGIICELIAGLISELPSGTRLWVTADHGMINVGDSVVLGENNKLMQNITLLGGEPRARHLYVTEGSALDVQGEWRTYFGDRIDIRTRAEVIESGLLGPSVSLDSEDRMGDLIAIPQGELILIDPERVPQESTMVGHHGGLTEAEVSIPLLTKTI